MGELNVKCKRCLEIISTGISMNLESFKNSQLCNNKVICPNCKAIVIWNKEDVLDN